MSEELKPCPFCGGEARYLPAYGVRCWSDACAAKIPCSLENAAAAWNTRPEPSVQEAARDVLAERRRQKDAEGWSEEHDDSHVFGELVGAAICYALSARSWRTEADMARLWPWSLDWWKPKDSRRALVCAAALIIAEIERLDRAALRAIAEKGGE